jgi:hypothetical protein
MVYTHRDGGKEENNAQNVVDRGRKETQIYDWVSRRASKKHERGRDDRKGVRTKHSRVERVRADVAENEGEK